MTQTLAPPPPAGAPSGGSRLRGIDWRSYAIYIGFAVVFLLFAIFLADDGFLSGTNLLNIFRQTAIISVMAVAMTFVISAAQIDLSVTDDPLPSPRQVESATRSVSPAELRVVERRGSPGEGDADHTVAL